MPDTTTPAKPSHGGRRTPGPGKTQGRPPKKPKEKAVSTTIVLSSAKALKALKRLAKKAKLTPGAYIERELDLAPTPLETLNRKAEALDQKLLKAHGSLDFEKVKNLTSQVNLIKRQIARLSLAPPELAPA